MAEAMKGIGMLLVIMLVLVEMAPGGEADQLKCGTVISYLHPCIPYVSGQGPAGGCCGGVRGLYSAARTTADRQSVCNCLKSVVRAHPSLSVSRAAALPRLCGVNVGYEISLSTDCTKVR